MTIEDAIAWLAARDASVLFRANGSLDSTVMVVLHGSPIKAEKPTLVAAVTEASQRLARYSVVEREMVAARRLRTPGATK